MTDSSSSDHTHNATGDATVAEVQRRATAQLQPGERLIWTGQPDINALRSQGMGCAMVIAVFFFIGALLLLLLAMGLMGGPSGFGRVGAIIFALVLGLAGYIILWSPGYARKRFLRSIYALTDQRAIVINASGRVESYASKDLAAMTLRANPDGTGDLVFGEIVRTVQDQRRVTTLGFIGLTRVAEVEKLVRDTLLGGA